MKAKELKLLSVEELSQKEKNIKKDLFDLNYQRKLGAVEKPAKFRYLKRDIARIHTIIKERELQDGGSSQKKK